MKFEKQLHKELVSWRENQIISETQAEQIQALYPQNKRAGLNIMLTIFSIIGALLVGSGIIIVFGRNWDELPIWMRTMLAFLPLVISQLLTAFLLFKKVKSDAWREGVGIFYTISIYACIAMIGQIYQAPGNFNSYLLLCSLLVLPICYVLKATMPMLIYIVGMTVWSYDNYLYFLALMLPAIPHIWVRLKENVYSAYSQLLMWCLAICGFFITLLGGLAFSDQHFLVIALYFSMLYLISVKFVDNEKPIMLQPLKVVGFTGGIIMLLFMSSRSIPYYFNTMELYLYDWVQIVMVSAMALFSLFLMYKIFDVKKPLKSAQELLIGGVFLAALAMKIIMPDYSSNMYWFSIRIGDVGAIYYVLLILANIYVLTIGVLLIINGLAKMKFSASCLGTIIIAYIIIARFFDTELDFLVRGLTFIVVGTLFLMSNLFIAKRIKKEALIDAKNN